MLTANLAKCNWLGLANGSRCRLEKIIFEELPPGADPIDTYARPACLLVRFYDEYIGSSFDNVEGGKIVPIFPIERKTTDKNRNSVTRS